MHIHLTFQTIKKYNLAFISNVSKKDHANWYHIGGSFHFFIFEFANNVKWNIYKVTIKEKKTCYQHLDANVPAEAAGKD